MGGESTCADRRFSDRWLLTTIVSEAIRDLEGVLEDEFLPDSGFFKCESTEDCELGPFSKSAGRGDNRGGRSKGLLEFDFDDDFESTGFINGVTFLE